MLSQAAAICIFVHIAVRMKFRPFLLALLVPAYGFSQSVSPDSVKTTVLDELVVTATRRQESLLQAPEVGWIHNLSIGSPAIYKNLGFNVNYREQAEFLWQSALATGNVPRYRTIDLQVSAGFLDGTLTAKIGGTNILNQYYYSFIGGPAIGCFYYLNLTYSLQRK